MPAGTYSATETASAAGYHQVSNTCTGLVIAGRNDSPTCQAHDTINTGTITVHKTVDAGTAAVTSFCFKLSPDPGNGQVCANTSGNAVFSNVPAGTYSASETASPATYHQVSNTCTNLVIAAQGSTQTCQLHDTINTGTITVHKTVDAGGAPVTSFCFTLSPDPGNHQVCANASGNAVFNNVPAGTYSATETASAAGYHQVSNTCTGLVIAAQGDTRTCDVHDTFTAIAHDVDAHLSVVGDIALGTSGTNTSAVKSDCKNEIPAEQVHCTLQVSGLPAGCTAKSSVGPLVSSPGGFMLNDLSSYAVNQTKHFDFKLTITCNPNLAKGVVAILQFKQCADGGFIDPDPAMTLTSRRIRPRTWTLSPPNCTDKT